MLYIVSVPIGNLDDMTARAVRVLRESHAVVCEEIRQGSRLLRAFQIEKELIDLNEHNEAERVPQLIRRLEQGETLALISDHGTPMLADPGSRWVQRAIEKGQAVSAVPGASSLLAALVVSGLPMERFHFLGLLPPKKEERQKALARLRDERDTWVVFDAPYRLLPLLTDVARAVGADRRMVIACDLTMPTEQIVRGTAESCLKHFEDNPFKGEFVLVVAGSSGGRPHRGVDHSRSSKTGMESP